LWQSGDLGVKQKLLFTFIDDHFTGTVRLIVDVEERLLCNTRFMTKIME